MAFPKKKKKVESDILKWLRESREKYIEGIERNEKEFTKLKKKYEK